MHVDLNVPRLLIPRGGVKPDLTHVRINTGQAATPPYTLRVLNEHFSVTASCLPTFGDVEIEEVTVEDGLYHARNHGDLVVEILGVVAPDPVCNVESTVEAQEEKVVGRDGLSFPCLADHEELRKDSHGLQVDGEGPEYLGGAKRRQWGVSAG